MRSTTRTWLSLAVLSLPLGSAASCGGDDGGVAGGGGVSASGGADAAAATGGTAAGGTGGNIVTDAASDSGCSTGQACGDGGICAGGVCCAANLACGQSCCAGGQVCTFGSCATPGQSCTETGDCPSGQYCDLSLGEDSDAGVTDGGADGGSCTGGVVFATGKCLPKPPTCAPGQDPGSPPTCLNACSYKPPSSSFSPVLKYAWGGEVTSPFATDVMMTPIVLQLDDDDCDGKLTDRDIPEIVFSTFSGGAYKGAGVLRAISIVGGQVVEKWSLPNVLNPTKQLAGGNFDGVPGNEIVGCGNDDRAHAVSSDGKVLWSSDPMPCFMPSIADLDQDGKPEVIVEGGILDGATGQLKHAFSAPLASSFVVSDIDGDGKLDVVTGSQGFDAQGQLFVDTGQANTGQFADTSDWKSPWPAIADFDGDGKPEVIVVHNLAHTLSVWRYDAAAAQKFTVVRGPIDINGPLPASTCPTGAWGNTHGGGPPTVADFNGDGTPDVALAGGVGYAVFDGKKLVDPTVAPLATLLWIKETTDCSSASTGSTVFDFNGDGIAEVIYSDELKLRIYDGPTGNVLWETCNTTATLIENPVVADVDNDGHADIIAVSNAYARTCPDDGSRQGGVRVFGDPDGKWVRTRRVWNQHAYHVTNLEEDGTVPAVQAPNVSTPGLNNFRQNKQPGSEFAAPDAIVSVAPKCAGAYGLYVTVTNVGEASLPAGVVVGVYQGSAPPGTLLGTLTTTKPLYALEAQSLLLPLGSVPSGLVFAIVDDTTTPHPEWTECRTDNNVSSAVNPDCAVPR
ncbi:MAG: VCBS repeat-containing protein [Polyangiaceae bacterium]|nr:VCBS repeat-containing protein [Polyangiaceae bacterium]